MVHCALDDLIPFNEYFALVYVSWYALVFGSLLFTLLYDVESFKRLQIFLICTQLTAMAVYILWPSCQNLRPEVFPRDNLLTRLMAFIYSFDTNTGVCPSLHVAYTVGIASVAWKSRSFPLWGKVALLVMTLLVSLAVCFVKQHSAVDVFAALPLCLFAEFVTFGKSWWLPRLRGETA